MKSRLVLLVFAALVAAAGTADAQLDDSSFGGRIFYVASSTTSDHLGDTESRIQFDSGVGAEFDATIKISRLFSAEFSIGLSGHQLTVTGTDCCGEVDGGYAFVIPLTVLAQYHHPVYGDWDPYVGIGLTWAAPIYSISSEMEESGIERLDLDGGGGLAAQIGVNYMMDNRWYANLDLRYLGYSLEARTRTTDGDLPTVDLDTKPWVIGVGFGYKF